MKKSCVRDVKEISLHVTEGELVMDFIGDGFLQNMIRILVGTLVEVGEGKRRASQMEDILTLAIAPAPLHRACLRALP